MTVPPDVTLVVTALGFPAAKLTLGQSTSYDGVRLFGAAVLHMYLFCRPCP